MNKKLTVTLSVDAKTGEVTAVRNSFDKLDRKVGAVQKNLTGMATKLVAVVGFTAAVYGLAKAFSFVVRSGFDYNKQMDASTAKLTAMISASKGYETVSGRMVSAQERQRLISQETEQMMQILKKTNAQTAMGMSELVDIYALAKPGMDRYKWAVKDQIEIVKLASNTASNFGMSAEELSTGIDDLAAGTWEASSGFGKMMKTLGVSREEYKATADKVGYLKDKMKETGEAQDTWATATSNFQVAWDNMAGQITQPIFNGVKEAIKHITTQMETYAPDAMQVFSDALVGMVNGGISAISTLIGWISKAVSGFRLAVAGYDKLRGALGMALNVDTSAGLQNIKELEQRLAKLGNTDRRGNSTSSMKRAIEQSIASIKEEMQVYEQYKKIRIGGDESIDNILKFDEKMQGIASTVKNINIKKGIVHPITEAVDPAEQLAYKLNKFDGQTKTNTKSLNAQAKAATKALEAQKNLNREYMKLTGDKSGLFQVDVEETMQKFIDSGAYSGEQLSKIYDGMWDDYQDKAKESASNVHTWLKDAFNIDSDSIFGKLFDDFSGLFDGLIGVLQSDKGINGALADLNLGVRGAEMLQKSGDPMLAGIGYGIEALGALFSNSLSEAEIKAATGRNEFDSESITKSISLLDGVVSEQTPIMQNSLRMLEALNDKFGSIAVAISSSSNGLDLDGSEFQNSQSAGFLGFSTSSSTLIGAGIKFGEQTISSFVQGVDAVGYEAVKETSSSFWGLVQNESIKEIEKGLPDALKQDLALAFNDSVEAVMQAATILGFDTDAIQAQVDQYVLDLGKLNFNELDASEQAKALSDAFSEQLDGAFSDAIHSLVDPQNAQALENMAKAGESYTETLVRAAVQLETVAQSLSYFGIAVDNFDVADKLVQAAGGLEKWSSAQSTFVNNFLSDAEQQAYLKANLTDTLALYDKSIPASKAQFVALKLETEAKIVNVQATISTLKAEIAAKVASGEMSIKAAYGELEAKATIAQAQSDVTQWQISANNSLINSSHESGKAVVGFGNSLNAAIEGIATGTAQAVIDGSEVDAGGLDFASITSPAIQAAEAELANLEGLYGSLMDNMGAFSDYYDGVESAASAAADKLNELEKSLVSIANLKAVWGEDDISAKKIILDATKRYTGLHDLTYDNFLERFESLTASGLGLDQETLSAWTDMSNALRALEEAEQARLQADKELTRKDIDFYGGILETIDNAFTGANSYLNSFEKSQYLDERAQYYNAVNDNESYIKVLEQRLTFDKQMSTTKEEYASSFDLYLEEVKQQEPDATTEDVVNELQKLRDELEEIRDAVEKASYQKAG